MRRNKKLKVEVRRQADGNTKQGMRDDIESLFENFDATVEIKSVEGDGSKIRAKLKFPHQRAGTTPAGDLRDALKDEFESYTVL